MLGPKIEALPEDHSSKPECLFWLSKLFDSVGNHVEEKRLLVHTLELWRAQGGDSEVAEILRSISSADRLLHLYKEGIERAGEALEIYEQLNDIREQARSWQQLAWLLYDDGQLDAAEEAASQVIELLSDEDDKFPVCECYRLLGNVCRSRGEAEKAIEHLETALGIASTFNWHDQQFWNHYSLTQVSLGQNKFDDAHAHIERAKPCAINDQYDLGRAMELQARVWYKERRFEEATSEALYAASIFEKIGAAKEVEGCTAILRDVEEAINHRATSHEQDFNGELLEMILHPMPVDSPFSA